MHRVTARSLLVLLLVGVFVPVGLAIAAAPPHACCLRKAMHDGAPHSQFQGVRRDAANTIVAVPSLSLNGRM
jgi:hypothetical protein